jgi:glucuronyl esterase-like protein
MRITAEELRAALPPCPVWDAWADASLEAPPDFSRLRPRPDVWSPVEGLAGPSGWPARRAAIRGRWRRWLLGTVPEGAPLPRVRVVAPEGARGVPVLMTQTSHVAWAAAALRRGWAACLVSACDSDDVTDELHGASRLAWRGWALSRALDLLQDDPRVDAARVVVAGHSRNGKAALIAAGFDPRFAAVVSSSSGVLGAIPARLCTDRHFGEGVELLTRHYPEWYLPRLRWFSGREQHLPTDAHELLALAAPRPVLVALADNDPVESTWAAERAVAAAGEAHALLGAPGAITLQRRPGGHEASTETIEGYLDWAQDALEGACAPSAPVLHGGSWARWRTVPPAPRVPGPLAPAVAAALGAAPPALGVAAASSYGEREHAAHLLGRGHPAPGTAAVRLVTGDGVDLTVLLPAERDPAAPLPLALWLGPGCRATGWVAGYEQAEPLPVQLARAGWAVACHDPIGTGGRVLERLRTPGWSPLGRMVADAAGVLAAARTLEAAVAPGAPVIAGYGTGAVVGLHLALAVPARALALAAPTASDAVLAAPAAYGLGDLLAAVRVPTLVVDPKWDPEAPRGAVAAACRSAGPHVEHVPIRDWHRLSGETRAAMLAWLAGAAASAPPLIAAA